MCPLFASALGYARQTPGFPKFCQGCFGATWAALPLDATAWLAEALCTTPSASGVAGVKGCFETAIRLAVCDIGQEWTDASSALMETIHEQES